MDNQVNRQIGNYRVDALIGGGGMGAVYRAYDVKLAQTVALKVMHAHLANSAAFQQRFLQEAQAAARLKDHPNIVPIYYFGENQGLLYMVMRYVSGGSLSTHIRQLQKTGEVVSLKEILFLLAQVADALGYAHRLGVVHRDIKPGNILLQPSEKPDREEDPPLQAIVSDFGLAKLLEGGLDTRTGEIMGTYDYMSPEQCLQRKVDGRSDIYALGVMLYQLATGSLPFEIKSATDAVMKHLHESPPAPRSVCPDLPESVEAIILKAIAKAPEERYPTAEKMAQALREVARKLTDADITQFSGGQTVFDLATHVRDYSVGIEPSQTGGDLTPLASQDQLVISQRGHTPYAIPLPSQDLTIGRSSDNDVVLDHPDVSHRHARLEFGPAGWQITDLKSTNGTYLDNIALLANVPEAFSPGKTLRIGPFYIQLRPALKKPKSDPGPILRDRDEKPLPPDDENLPDHESRTGQIGVTLRTPVVEVQPGNRVEVSLSLFNQGKLVDQFRLRVTGLPPDWVNMPQAFIELMPGSPAACTFYIQPPEDSSAKAGAHPYQLIIESAAAPGETVKADGQVVVKAFERFTIELYPSRVPHGGSSLVTIRNEGNVEGTYSLVGRDSANELKFEGEQARVQVPAGGTVSKKVIVKAKKRPVLGSKRSIPFEVYARASTRSSLGARNAIQTAKGQVDLRPYVSSGVMATLGVLLVVGLLGGGYGLNALNRQRTNAAQLARSQETATAGAVLAVEVTQAYSRAGTQTAVRAATQSAAVESTALAQTAVAQGDNDSDGLSNQKELEIGTDPNVADTDQDGLTDGLEVNVYGTKPLNQDSDGDTLSDGEEVNQYHTSPNNPDTDGDGVPDGSEIRNGTDPLLIASATPPPKATLTPTSLAQNPPYFGAVTFCADPDCAAGTATKYPEGTKQVFFIFEYHHMRSGMSYGRRWYVNGDLYLDYTCTWGSNWPSDGQFLKRVYDEVNGLAPGEWRIEILLEGKVQATAAFTVKGTPRSEQFLNYSCNDTSPTYP